MKLLKFSGLVLAGLISLPGQLFAANSVLSGMFDSTVPKAAQFESSERSQRQCKIISVEKFSYQDAGSFQVASNGSYFVADIFDIYFGVNVMAFIYSGAFDPSNPQLNLVTPEGIDYSGSVELSSGVNYRLVVQQACSNKEGAWALTFSGPGAVTADTVRMVPAMTEGVFQGSDPLATTDCGINLPYREIPAMQVAESGRYYYSDVHRWDQDPELSQNFQDVCVQVFTAPFDPADPMANRVDAKLIINSNEAVGFMDDFNTIDLEAGQDYYFVIQPLDELFGGEYFFALTPPAPFRINKSLAGAWYFPETAGQGLVLDVYGDGNTMFVTWFTYDLERPDPSYIAMIGEPGHRWMTAQGPFSGNSAELPIFYFSGMIFDSPTPTFEGPLEDGSLSIEFYSCNRGQVSYDLGSANTVGVFPIQTIADDHVELCEQFTKVPGMPGPL